MRKLALLLLPFLLGACAFVPGYYPAGLIYNGTTTPHGVNRLETSGEGKTGDRRGEACVTGIVWLVAWGDASIDAAKKDGGISDVHSVELASTSILGLYAQGCTVVYGK